MAWRIYDGRGYATADLLTIDEGDPGDMDVLRMHHPSDHTKYRIMKRSEISRTEPLHVKVLDEGKLVYDFPPIDEIRKRRIADIESLDTGVRRIMNPHIYHVSLSEKLWMLKQALIHSIEKENA
jgi:nicotinate phosphoribosyltransferase